MPHQDSAHKGQHRQTQTQTQYPRQKRISSPSTRTARGSQEKYPRGTRLTELIEQDIPLFTHSQLVLMYGPFQAEMRPGTNQGVASWLREQIRDHGLPSLIRFDCRQRAQIFRRDQFQPWFQPLIDAPLDRAC